MSINFNKILQNPSVFFVSPHEVLQSQSFTVEQKVRILSQWEYDERELAVAEEENMAGGPSNRLDEVLQALRELVDDDNADQAPPTKQGGH